MVYDITRTSEETPIMLSHLSGDCTGNWRLIGVGENRTVRCDKCNVGVQATPENRLAAIDENYAGIYLRRLTAEGIAHLQ
jgi:hypothetical protein